MDVLYQQSTVLIALRDVLRDLMKDNFITREVADRIFTKACEVFVISVKSFVNLSLFFVGFSSLS